MSDQFLKNQDENFIANESWAFYSSISNPSFKGFPDEGSSPDEGSRKEKYFLGQFMINPYVREIMLGNLDTKQVKLALMWFNIIISSNNITTLDNKLDLTPTANVFSRKLLALVLLSMGRDQAFLKTMLTNYSITEQKLEEKAYQEIKQDQKEEQKKEWKFLPKSFGRK